MLTRRNLLATAAPAVLLTGCGITINPSTGQVTLPANVIDAITAAVAFAAKYVPTAESIAATAAALFGPQYVTLVTIGSSAINAVIAYLTNLVKPPAPTPAPASLKAYRRYRLAVPSAPLVGYTQNGIAIFGYRQ